MYAASRVLQHINTSMQRSQINNLLLCFDQIIPQTYKIPQIIWTVVLMPKKRMGLTEFPPRGKWVVPAPKELGLAPRDLWMRSEAGQVKEQCRDVRACHALCLDDYGRLLTYLTRATSVFCFSESRLFGE